MSALEHARTGFAAHFGHEPDGIAFAPGRVNLMGEHVDYNDGLVLPMPISVGTAVAWSAMLADRIAAVALNFGNASDSFTIGQVRPHASVDWRSYLRGTATSLAQRGLSQGGAKLAISGTIPRGAGLSSSASLCVAIARALAAAGGINAPEQRELAFAAQSAEHEWAGVNCGIMDQMAIAAGTPGSALLLDCRSLATRVVSLPQDWAVMIVQSGVKRGLVDGHYNQRRRDCEAAAAALGVASLRDATPVQVERGNIDAKIRQRAWHVVCEIARTAAMVDAIERVDLVTVGRLLGESHASLRDEFEVSVPAVDGLVDQLAAAIGSQGGARMTGGGFGGAVVAILKRDAIAQVRAAVEATYRTPDGAVPEFLIETANGSAIREIE
jgi:galactokinase